MQFKKNVLLIKFLRKNLFIYFVIVFQCSKFAASKNWMINK